MVTEVIDDTEKQIRTVAIDTKFTPDARKHIAEFLRSFESFEPTLGLLYGALPPDGSGPGSWSIAALARQTLGLASGRQNDTPPEKRSVRIWPRNRPG